MSEVQREKIRISLLGNSHTLGHKLTQEHKTKISLGLMGKKVSIETRKKIRLAHLGKIISQETRDKIRISKLGKKGYWKNKKRPSISGKNCYKWKGGITPENERIRKSLKYRMWRESVFKRDNYTCMDCGARNGNGKKIILHAHHIKPFYLFPKLRFDLSNGKTLCIKCHKKTY